MSYFCGGCLQGWRKHHAMPCDTCNQMLQSADWTCDRCDVGTCYHRIREVWEPIVAYCEAQGIKAWVPEPNRYQPRLPMRSTVEMPPGDDPFHASQRSFVNLFRRDPTQAHWDLLHPETQRRLRI